MSKQINPDGIPSAGNAEVKTEKVLLKNVLFGKDGREDIEVEVVPFNPYDDKHTEFAFAYIDLISGMPSHLKNMSDVSRGYVRIFMVHKEGDEKFENSRYSKVLGDTRACRTLFNLPNITQTLHDFFENA